MRARDQRLGSRRQQHASEERGQPSNARWTRWSSEDPDNQLHSSHLLQPTAPDDGRMVRYVGSVVSFLCRSSLEAETATIRTGR